MEIETLKQNKLNPNDLPFLQAQILIKLYSDISNKIVTRIEDIAVITTYPFESKIQKSAIESLIKKGFISGSFEEGFYVPNEAQAIYQNVIQKIDFHSKEYSKRLLEISLLSTPNNSLFDETKSLSELNREGIIHRWYNYLEEFPYSLTEEKLKEYNINSKSLVVDPFVGSGTTLVTARMFHCKSIGFDSNPLMTFISNVKTNWEFNLEQLECTIKEITTEFLNKVHYLDKIKLRSKFLYNMPKKEINQWLSLTMQKEVALLKDIIENKTNNDTRNLLLLALSKACFDGSYVALCPGTTFYPFREKREFWDLFIDKIIQIFADLKSVQKFNSFLKTELINDSCLNATKYLSNESIDFIITSPPYPNDLEYTRQTRLELYLLDFVEDMQDVQALKREMVKSSTKLIYKESSSEKRISNFNSVKIISDKIYEQTKEKNWGFDYPRMVREYFGDMYLCLKEFYPLMKRESKFLLVVGDQTIKSIYIPVCDILIEMANHLGYKNCKKELFRIRRSTGHNIQLPEEIVILEK